MNREARKGIQRVEENIYKRTDVSSTRLRYKKMRIEVNTLDYVTGRILSMECEDEQWKPVAFLSKSLNETERNYKIHNKKILVVIRGLENWKHLLEGEKFKFEVWTNHKNLEYFIKAQKLNKRQACWTLYLSRFDFTLKYMLGTKMGKADGLSRRPDWKVGIEKDNENQTLIKVAREKNKEIVRVVKEMKKARVKALWGDE